MRFIWLFSIFFLSVVPSHPLAAQGHRYAQAAPVNPPGFEQYLELYGLGRGRPPFLLPTPRPPEADAAQGEETRFGYWAYRHKELHARKVIDELVARIPGTTCCNGIHRGECRVSKVRLYDKMAFVDGEWCPISKDTRWTPLDTLTDITDGDEEIAVVCASKSEGKRLCLGVTVYCIGLKPPKA